PCSARGPESWGCPSPRRSPGPSTTGWAWPRPPSNPRPATSPSTSAKTACASTSSRPDRSRPPPPPRSPVSERSRTCGATVRPWAGTRPTPLRRARRSSPCSRTGSPRPPAKWSTSTAASTPPAPEAAHASAHSRPPRQGGGARTHRLRTVADSKGLAQAVEAGAEIAERWSPDVAIASAARRTVQTGQAVVEAVNRAHGGSIDEPGRLSLREDASLYAGEIADWMDAINSIPSDAACAYIVGHQPTVSEVIGHLNPAGGVPTGFRPSSIAVFDLDSWDREPGEYPA